MSLRIKWPANLVFREHALNAHQEVLALTAAVHPLYGLLVRAPTLRKILVSLSHSSFSVGVRKIMKHSVVIASFLPLNFDHRSG